jgi:hypothetical protein
MDQAIQIATSQQPGKVLFAVSSEGLGKPGKLAKMDRVLSRHDRERRRARSHDIWVNAIDGTIIKTRKNSHAKREQVFTRRLRDKRHQPLS